jgi:6-phosphogluconolactonase
MNFCYNVILGLALFASMAPSSIMRASGFVYVMTNATANSVNQYSRGDDGSLTFVQNVLTGGSGGSGNGVGNLDPLGSQDSLVLNSAGSLLVAVNAGSNQLSSISAGSGGLRLLSTVGSGGVFPNSVAVNGTLVYVLNAHSPNISGFRLDSTGTLSPIPGSTFTIPGSGLVSPHDIRFTPDGTRLVVTVEGTNQIDIFDLNNSGVVTGVKSQPAAGVGPFGFKFGRGGVLINAEATSASVSSYELTSQDTLRVISPAVTDGQAATCWISLTADGKFGFVSNTGSGTISTYHVSNDGTLSLENAVTASLSGGAPIDSALSSDSAFFYVLDSQSGGIVFYRVTGGSLHRLGSVTGLPTSIQGIAAQ